MEVNFRNISRAIDNFHRDVKRFPSSLSELLQKPGKGKNWKGPYLKVIPTDPWKRVYIYKTPGRWGVPYELISYGKDGEKGGDGLSGDFSSYEELVGTGGSTKGVRDRSSDDDKKTDSQEKGK